MLDTKKLGHILVQFLVINIIFYTTFSIIYLALMD